MERNSSRIRRGYGFGVAAYLLWGLFPPFFALLEFAKPIEVLAHRIVWTMVVTTIGLLVVGRLRTLREIPGRTWLFAAAGVIALSINWGVYIVGVTSGRVVECALGYYSNPLVSVLLGVLVFRERLTRAQIAAVVLAGIAVVVLALGYGRPPVIALTLAFSFAIYGLIKKLVPLDPARGLAAESLIAAPIALAYLGYLAATGEGAVHPGGGWHQGLLVVSGPVTAVPLLLFAAAAQRIPLTTIGILQYLTPSIQLAWGVLVGHEAMPRVRWAGFVLIWVALTMFTVDALVRARRARVDAGEVADRDRPVETGACA